MSGLRELGRIPNQRDNIPPPAKLTGVNPSIPYTGPSPLGQLGRQPGFSERPYAKAPDGYANQLLEFGRQNADRHPEYSPPSNSNGGRMRKVKKSRKTKKRRSSKSRRTKKYKK